MQHERFTPGDVYLARMDTGADWRAEIEPLEVAACVGNVALLGDDVFAHTHAVLSRSSGETVAGHLDSATVFAGEVSLQVFEESLVREYDDRTGLDLWL